MWSGGGGGGRLVRFCCLPEYEGVTGALFLALPAQERCSIRQTRKMRAAALGSRP